MSEVLYFYTRAVVDDSAAYFNHGKGIAGYKEPLEDKNLYFKGTMDELDEYLKKLRSRAAKSHNVGLRISD